MTGEFHSVRIATERCTGRMACLRACPTEAIRVRQGKAAIYEDRCIDCGECVRACPNAAILPRTGSFTDLSRFKYTVALPSPVLYGQFRKDVLPGAILRALKKIGFHDAWDVAHASEAVSFAIDEYLADYRGPLPLLSPFCPVVVRLVQARFPDLIDQLIPIDSPMEIAAREVKTRKARELDLRQEEIGVIYLSPCPAKMVAVNHPPRKRVSDVDGVIAISDVYQPLLAALSKALEEGPQVQDAIGGLGLGWPVLGGQVASLRAETTLAVGGLRDVTRILEEAENGKLGDLRFVECQACPEGCCSGPLTVENPYFARGKILNLVARFGDKPSQDRGTIRELYRQGYFSLPGQIPARPFSPLDSEIARAIEKRARIQQLNERLPGIDCGVCGAPTCLSFAEDVILGRASEQDCVVLALRHMQAAEGGSLAVSGRGGKS